MPRRKKDPRGFVRETGTYMGKHYDLRAKTEKELNEKIRAKRAEIESGSKLIEAGVTVKEWGETLGRNLQVRREGIHAQAD